MFAVDIDQTICGSNAHEVYARFHNEDLDLHIEPIVLDQLTSYRDFFFLPQVVSFRQAHEQEWNASRRRAIATPSVLEAFLPISNAASGIERLAQSGTVCYYTARSPEVRAVTQDWLKRYHFPCSQAVCCCESIERKVLALAEHQPDDEPIVLVDDRGHTHFLAMLKRLQEDQRIRDLTRRLAILAFGASSSELPEQSLCPVIALPCWSELERVLHDLHSR
jgi:uncharacterized HAD superfamily protein